MDGKPVEYLFRVFCGEMPQARARGTPSDPFPTYVGTPGSESDANMLNVYHVENGITEKDTIVTLRTRHKRRPQQPSPGAPGLKRYIARRAPDPTRFAA
jgi:hypothetical protein